jgi:4-hydroxy-2-oxoheptanedioate aldolase
VAGEIVTGAEFKKQLRAGQPKMGLFLNSHSSTVAEQLAHSGRGGVQQALDLGADGVLIPYINTAAEAKQVVSCAKYPTGVNAIWRARR